MTASPGYLLGVSSTEHFSGRVQFGVWNTGPGSARGALGLQLLLNPVNLVEGLDTAVSNDAYCSENILRRYKLTIFHTMFGSRP
jgi:hypothetical protein